MGKMREKSKLKLIFLSLEKENEKSDPLDTR